MPYIDYSNTGLFVNNTTNPDTKEKNAELKAMYNAFYNHITSKRYELTDFNAEKYNGIQLLTCFDSYVKADKKIMILGQEANTDEGNIFDFLRQYQNDCYYKYEYKIAHVGEMGISKSECRLTEYLKTRKLICRSNNNEDRESEILSVLSNNLNKTSLKGKRTECYPPGEPNRKSGKYEQYKLRDKIIYSEFCWKGFMGNIYLHELNILRPTHLVFLSGPGYRNHIIRDFGGGFYEKIKNAIDSLSVSDNPAVADDEYNLSEKEISKLFHIDGYKSGIKILYAYHPFARLKEARTVYNKRIEDFLK